MSSFHQLVLVLPVFVHLQSCFKAFRLFLEALWPLCVACLAQGRALEGRLGQLLTGLPIMVPRIMWPPRTLPSPGPSVGEGTRGKGANNTSLASCFPPDFLTPPSNNNCLYFSDCFASCCHQTAQDRPIVGKSVRPPPVPLQVELQCSWVML